MNSIVTGNKIAYFRFEQGLSLRELSERSGLDSITIHRIEKGHSKPRAKTAKALSEALHVPVNELFVLNDRIACGGENCASNGE